MQKEQWPCRVAPSLGDGFAGTPYEVWGCKKYNEVEDTEKKTVFFGIYGLPDFFALWRHKGDKYILWAGSDIRHLKNGYWLDKEGNIRISPQAICEWINKNCISYVENRQERNMLLGMGIESEVVPSFLGNVDDYEVCYKYNPRPKVYASVSGNNFELYKWHLINEVATSVPEIEFHLFGNTVPFETNNKNVIVRGRVSQEEMNTEIKTMQCGLRLIEVEGCSEVIVKSALWGQWPISRIYYPAITNILNKKELLISLRDLVNKKEPDLSARQWFLDNLNKYPWNSNL